MAEAIGVASGLLALASFAFKSSVTLYQTVESFKSHQQRVRDLVDELNALGGVLNSLTETVNSISDVDFSALKIPLLRCGNACLEFKGEILKFSSRSRGERTSFRDWAKLKYMGEDLDGFRRLLAGYKMTINVALTDATLRRSSVTADAIASYNDLLSTAKADLEDRLEMIDEKLELMLGKSGANSESDTSEIKLIKEERLSAEKCLQICAQLSDHISQIQFAAKDNASSNESMDSETLPEKITSEGLQDCKDALARTAQKLEGYEKEVFARLMEKCKTALDSEEDVVNLTRLRHEWEATRQGMDICSKARDNLKENVSIIDNYAIGDAIQFMVSTNGKTIQGKNRGLGWRTRQIGGHLSDESVQEIARVLGSIGTPAPGHGRPSSRGDTAAGSENETQRANYSKFEVQYGKGFNLPPESTTSPSTAYMGSAEVASSSSKKD